MKRFARQAVAAMAVKSHLWSIVEAGSAVVLRYHRVCGSADEPAPLAVTPEEFDAQLAFLKERCAVVSARTVAEAVIEERPLPPRAVAITFDDGYEDNVSAAFPILKKHGLTATFFITAGWVESARVLWWDRLHEYVRQAAAEGTEPIGYGDLPPPVARVLAGASFAGPAGPATVERGLVAAIRGLNASPNDVETLVECIAEALGADEVDTEPYQPMNWFQVEILHEGGMEIGSHTMSHARLATVPAERAFEELAQSKRLLEEKLGTDIDLLAYPAGNHDRDVMDLAAEAGYDAAFTTETGAVRSGDDPFGLRRIGVWSGGYRGVSSYFSPEVFGLQIGRLARHGGPSEG